MIVLLLLIGVIVISYIIYMIFFWQWKKNCQPFYNQEQPVIFGHRGSPSLITENTLPSFQQAINQKVDGLEFDIRLSADEQIVIFHDKDLSRLSDRSDKINKLTLSELQTIDLHGGEDELRGIYIPSLNDIVPLLNYIKVLNVEIKSDGLFKGHNILKPLIEFLNKHQIDDKCIISSFNPLILMRLRLQRPETVIGFLYNRNRLFHGWDNMIWMFRVQPENLHIHYSMLSHWIVKWARNKGMRINSYTINDKKVFDNADIDGVFTDNIEYLK